MGKMDSLMWEVKACLTKKPGKDRGEDIGEGELEERKLVKLGRKHVQAWEMRKSYLFEETL